MSKTKKESTVNLQSEFERYATFKKWPFDNTKKCNTKKLAEAGFYKCGRHQDVDLVKCFLCGKELDGWGENDDPWEEHIAHASYCMFAMIRKPEASMTLMEYLNVTHQLQINTIKNKFDERAEILDEAVKKMNMQIKFYKLK